MAEGDTTEYLDINSKSNLCQSAQKLSECLKSSVQTLLDNVTDEIFVSHYKELFKQIEKRDDIGRPSLSGSSVEGRKYHSQFNDFVKKSVFATIDDTVSSMNKRFKELEKLIAEQADNTVEWRPPGNAAEHLVPFEYVCEMEKKKELEGKIEREKEVIEALKSRLVKKRKKAIELSEKLNASIAKIRDEVCNEVNNKANE